MTPRARQAVLKGGDTMNQVQLIGRMAREPELRRTEKGTPVVSFALNTHETFNLQIHVVEL